jgi:hypothetical protein
MLAKRLILLISCVFLLILPAAAQRYLADYDSTLFFRDTLRPFLKRFENLHISGYIQPQFQVAESEGARSYEGGDFAPFANNRFMLRRARLKADYILPSKETHLPLALFTFQFDATERGVNVRDMFLRLYEPKKHNFSFTMGLFARPFGYEVNLSSAYRETPERGRMSQILMPTERDLGAAISYESQNANRKKLQLKWDAGFFNGQGLAGTADFDSYKDFITRLTLKPVALSNFFSLSAGLSYLNGGWREATKYRYEMSDVAGKPLFVVDSNEENIGRKAPRIYYGADAQLVYKHDWGKTEIRGEYWWGTQPGTAISTTNPGILPVIPTYIRNFDGAFLYFLQNIINEQWELMVKYDWYDPNTKVTSSQINNNTNLTLADVKFSTIGFGLTHYITPDLKILGYYDVVKNELTDLDGYKADAQDNMLTIRLQLRF